MANRLTDVIKAVWNNRSTTPVADMVALLQTIVWNFTSGINVTGTVAVTGNETVSGTLGVTGVSTLTGGVNAPSGNAAIRILTATYSFGNTTDNPTYNFLGTGAVTAHGPLAVVNGLNNVSTVQVSAPNTAGLSFGISVAAGTNGSDFAMSLRNAAGSLTFFGVRGDGNISFPALGTTANAATAFLDGSNNLLRSTSSIRYKTQVEDLSTEIQDSVLQMRPVWYRSKAEADRKDWSYLGLIAEEVAAIEPRLVHWAREQVGTQEVEIAGKRVVEPVYSDTLIPDAVQYERVAVALLGLVQRMHTAMTKAGIKIE